MRRMKEHPIMLTELILLFTLMAIVIWIGLSETDKYEILQGLLQGFLVLFNIAALVVGPFVMLWISSKPKEI